MGRVNRKIDNYKYEVIPVQSSLKPSNRSNDLTAFEPLMLAFENQVVS